MNIAVKLPLAAIALLSIGAAASAADGGRPFKVTMTGAVEKPGPGDPDGKGIADLRINPGKGQVCYTITVSKVDPVSAAHIHRAPPTEAGPPVVTLLPPTGKGCVNVDRALAQEIIKNPSAFYVNVHTGTFPLGALRAQLGR